MSAGIFASDILCVSKETIKYVETEINGSTSDGYHTFDDLYMQRMYLFAAILKQNKSKAWKSKLHHDGTMFNDYFIVGIKTKKGNYTYHYHIEHWNMFHVKELDRAPKHDGHTSKDVARMLNL